MPIFMPSSLLALTTSPPLIKYLQTTPPKQGIRRRGVQVSHVVLRYQVVSLGSLVILGGKCYGRAQEPSRLDDRSRPLRAPNNPRYKILGLWKSSCFLSTIRFTAHPSNMNCPRCERSSPILCIAKFVRWGVVKGTLMITLKMDAERAFDWPWKLVCSLSPQNLTRSYPCVWHNARQPFINAGH
ncbi:hypothetical protein VNO77_03798 [Canavalia gladiata]|uniref:Uncharacterized protein n=1 Tax=Canavalia gladiata TaxID=3824 RepID=A0AAN9MVC1_CANGL